MNMSNERPYTLPQYFHELESIIIKLWVTDEEIREATEELGVLMGWDRMHGLLDELRVVVSNTIHLTWEMEGKSPSKQEFWKVIGESVLKYLRDKLEE